MFISHDLSVVKHFCDRTCVLYLGKIVEIADSEVLYREPLHPYTQALIEAVPASDLAAPSVSERTGLEGDIPSPVDPPMGCRFHTRCPKRMEKCSQQEPQLREVKPGHRVACFLHE